jgi:hypothetical protein
VTQQFFGKFHHKKEKQRGKLLKKERRQLQKEMHQIILKPMRLLVSKSGLIRRKGVKRSAPD